MLIQSFSDDSEEIIYTSFSVGKPSTFNYSCVCVDPRGNPAWSWTDCDCTEERPFVCLQSRTKNINNFKYNIIRFLCVRKRERLFRLRWSEFFYALRLASCLGDRCTCMCRKRKDKILWHHPSRFHVQQRSFSRILLIIFL